jgi:ketosteroid isomerase-like protein
LKLITLIIASAALAATAPVRADDAADIRALEAEWSRAFLAADFDALERIVAPEFTLVRVEDGAADFTARDRWFTNARRMRFDRYETEIVGLTLTGDAAVATVAGHWTVTLAGRGTRAENFVVTDTWVRRAGTWQVVFRHSSPRPATAAAAPGGSAAEPPGE